MLIFSNVLHLCRMSSFVNHPPLSTVLLFRPSILSTMHLIDHSSFWQTSFVDCPNLLTILLFWPSSFVNHSLFRMLMFSYVLLCRPFFFVDHPSYLWSILLLTILCFECPPLSTILLCWLSPLLIILLSRPLCWCNRPSLSTILYFECLSFVCPPSSPILLCQPFFFVNHPSSS